MPSPSKSAVEIDPGETPSGVLAAAAIGAFALAAFALAPATIAQGAVGFQPPVAYAAAAGTRDVAVGDFNKDGNPDLAVSASNGLTALLNNSSPGFASFQAPANRVSELTPANWARSRS